MFIRRRAARASIPASRMHTTSAGSWRPCCAVPPKRCSTAMRKSAGRSPRACSGFPPGCSRPRSAASMRRGREVQQLDLGYPDPARGGGRSARGLLAGDRAPDAPVRGAAGQPTRLFELFKGPHWTLLGYQVERDAVPSRPGLHIHTTVRAATIDEGGHLRDAYALAPGIGCSCVLTATLVPSWALSRSIRSRVFWLSRGWSDAAVIARPYAQLRIRTGRSSTPRLSMIDPYRAAAYWMPRLRGA